MMEVIAQLLQHKDISASQMEEVMQQIMSGNADTKDIVSFLTALSEKGESVEELTAAVRVMRQHAAKVITKHKVVLDTCGTGGDSKHTFNISTAAAFVISGAGLVVAKHGNRSVSSKSGSADVLEALGIDINMSAEKVQRCLDDIGIAFLFAQNFHPATKYVMPARKQIGRRTIFNLLGPLSNPAGATHQLVGVYDKHWVEIIAKVLANLGSVRALVVHGEDGLDELTTTAKTFISEEIKGRIKNYWVAPEDFGLKKATLEDITGGDALMNARIILDILKGNLGPKRDIVVLNSAAAIFAADKAGSIKEGIGIAEQSIDSGMALGQLNRLKEYSLLN